MVAAQKQPELFPIEAWALARVINGMDVDPNIKARPKVMEIIGTLYSMKDVKYREHQLTSLIDPDSLELVRRVDVLAPIPKGRGNVPGVLALKGEEVKPKEEGSTRLKPTDDELAEQIMERWNGDYAYFYEHWQHYVDGLWKPESRNKLQFWQILIENKARGISPNKGKASSVADYCQLKLAVEDTALNQSKDYINLQNGLYNLETGQMEMHRRELYLTSQLTFAFDPRATCPTWIKFLNTVFVTPDGTPDMELAMLIQEAFGYSLTAYTYLRASFWLVGPTASGKSTLLKVLINLSGSGHQAIDLDAMKDNQYQMADVAGKRLVTFTEPDAKSPLADGQYKRLVSSDTVSARQIRGTPFNFVPECKVWGAMNDTPRVVDRSDAVYGRIIILPMLNAIPKDKWDLEIDSKLEAELPGIFNWALAGWKRLQASGQFTRAAQSEQARDDYKAENDAEATYVSERLERGAAYTVKADELYQDYKNWCEDNGFRAKNRNTVAKDWKRLGLVAQRRTAGNFYDGVRIRTLDLKQGGGEISF
jgi:P4 family phage/plasmid primase-like protien